MRKIILTEGQYVDFLNEKKLKFLRKNNCNTCKQKSKLKNLFEGVYIQEDLKVGKGTVCLNPNDVADYINSIRQSAIKIADKYQKFLEIDQFNKLQGKTLTKANPFIHGKSKLFFDDEGGVQTENKRITELKKELEILYKQYRNALNSKNENADNIARKIKQQLGTLLDIYDSLEVDIESFKRNLLKEPNTIISTNSKMMKSGGVNDVVVNTGIPAVGAIVFNVAENKFQMIETCPGRGACVNFCYALTSNYTRFNGTYDIMIRRLNLMINDPQKYEDKLFNELYALAITKKAIVSKEKMDDLMKSFVAMGKNKINSIKKQNPEFTYEDIFSMKKEDFSDEFNKYLTNYLSNIKRIVLRWNDSGDWFSELYLKVASNVVNRLRNAGVNLTTTTYTKIADVSADVKKLWNKQRDLAIYSIGGASKVETKKFNTATETNRPIKKAISPEGNSFTNPITNEPYDNLFSDFNYMINIEKQNEPNNKIFNAIAKDYLGIEEVDLGDSTQIAKIKSKIKELIPFVKEDLKEQMQTYLESKYNQNVNFNDIIYYDEIKKDIEKQNESEMRYYVIVPKGSGDDAAMYTSTKWVLNLLH
jgi:hypothetical protein